MKYYLYILISFFILTSCSDETKVQSVRLNPEELTLHVAETKQIEMLIKPISAIKYTPTAWESSDPNVATVDDNGNVSGIYAGECLITGKAMHKEGYCKVKVIAPDYDLNFDKAVIFRNGIDKTNNSENFILRLFEESIEIDSLGNASGNGIFLNINLYSKSDSELLTEGEYTVKNDSNAMSVIPGELKLIDGSYYATGSYLGQYSVNGLSALYIKEGSMKIKSDTYFCADCTFLGEKSEKINAIFKGIPTYYDTKDDENSNILKYDSVKTAVFLLKEEENVNHSKIIFSINDTIIEFTARHPKSTDILPDGNYYMSYIQKSFTLLTPENTNNCVLISNFDTTLINTAKLQISTIDNNKYYNAFFSTVNDDNFMLIPKQHVYDISKIKIK